MKTKIKYDILKQAYDYVFDDLEVNEFYPVLDLQEKNRRMVWFTS